MSVIDTVITWGALACGAIYANSPRPSLWTLAASIGYLGIACATIAMAAFK